MFEIKKKRTHEYLYGVCFTVFDHKIQIIILYIILLYILY